MMPTGYSIRLAKPNDGVSRPQVERQAAHPFLTCLEKPELTPEILNQTNTAEDFEHLAQLSPQQVELESAPMVYSISESFC